MAPRTQDSGNKILKLLGFGTEEDPEQIADSRKNKRIKECGEKYFKHINVFSYEEGYFPNFTVVFVGSHQFHIGFGERPVQPMHYALDTLCAYVYKLKDMFIPNPELISEVLLEEDDIAFLNKVDDEAIKNVW